MKILYLSTWDFTNEESDGVCKKIYSQLSVFEKKRYDVDFIYIKNRKIIYKECGTERYIGNVGSIKKTPAYMKMYKYLKNKKYDWVYNRYGMMDTFYYRVLKKLHDNGAKILIEIPTYPYAGEMPKGLLYRLMLIWDIAYIRKLKKVVFRIATYSPDDEIYHIKTIRIKNGVDFSKIRLRDKKQAQVNNAIDLIGVAHLSKWHGFDRVIEGMHAYYVGDKRETRINFHIVGEGDVLPEYKQMIRKYQLEEYVYFYGNKSGKELDDIYSCCDIAISSLALHRIGIYGQASVLKSREYSAKGFPIISSIGIDIFDAAEYRYIKYFPEDDSPINMKEIIDFYNEVYREGDIRHIIRSYGYNQCDITAVLQPIIDCIEGVCNE